MARLVLEGTWEEIAAHADDLIGKRLKVFVEEEALEEDEVPNIGSLGEEALRMKQEMAKYRKRHPEMSETVAILRYGRSGPMYGMP